MEAANIAPYERVQVVNLSNGSRLETYVIPGKRRSGAVCLNGPAARLGVPGDKVHVISYCVVPESEVKGWKPKVVSLRPQNKIAHN
jgi:aspartate 1-decarboxylase